MNSNNKTDTGGRVHPDPIDRFPDDNHKGLTLLDYFAGQALIGIFHNKTTCEAIQRAADSRGQLVQESAAQSAYDIAAAMIAEKRRMEAE